MKIYIRLKKKHPYGSMFFGNHRVVSKMLEPHQEIDIDDKEFKRLSKAPEVSEWFDIEFTKPVYKKPVPQEAEAASPMPEAKVPEAVKEAKKVLRKKKKKASK